MQEDPCKKKKLVDLRLTQKKTHTDMQKITGYYTSKISNHPVILHLKFFIGEEKTCEPAPAVST